MRQDSVPWIANHTSYRSVVQRGVFLEACACETSPSSYLLRTRAFSATSEEKPHARYKLCARVQSKLVNGDESKPD